MAPRPPHPAGTPRICGQLALTVGRLLEVDVGIAQGAAGDHIAADPDGQHRPRRAELFIQHGLGDIRVQVTHVQGGHGVAAGGSVHLPGPHDPKPRQDSSRGPHRTKGVLPGAGPAPRLTGGSAGVGSEAGGTEQFGGGSLETAGPQTKGSQKKTKKKQYGPPGEFVISSSEISKIKCMKRGTSLQITEIL